MNWLFGCVFSKEQIFVCIIFSGESTNQTSVKRNLPFLPGLGPILHDYYGGGCFCYCSEMFSFQTEHLIESPQPCWEEQGLPRQRGVGFNPFQHPNEIFLFAPWAGWAMFHFKMSGLELQILSWACTQHTGRRGFLKSQSLHRVNMTHLPVIHLNVLSKLPPQGNWAFFLLLLLLEVFSSVWNILFLTLETITCLWNNSGPGKEMFCICFYG